MAQEKLTTAHLSGHRQAVFSVIIPVYNSAATLARAVSSALEQSWPAHEIIIIDDGSTDESLRVAGGFGDQVRVIHQPNAGVSVARNRGAEVANGDWLAFLDADDWYYPDRLKWHADWIARDPSLDFLTGDYEYRREDGTLVGTSMAMHPSGRAMLEKSDGAKKVVMERVEIGSYVAEHFGDIHTLSVPRETFRALGGFPTGFKVCEDVHFLSRLCAVSRRVGVICQPLGVYLIHGSSATRADPLKAQECNVETLLDLKRLATDFPKSVRHGVMSRLRDGRLNLGYALVKAGRRRHALQAVLPSLFETPGWTAFRNVMSILKG